MVDSPCHAPISTIAPSAGPDRASSYSTVRSAGRSIVWRSHAAPVILPAPPATYPLASEREYTTPSGEEGGRGGIGRGRGTSRRRGQGERATRRNRHRSSPG